MKFGKLESIAGVDWRLRPETTLSRELLSKTVAERAHEPLRISFGAPVWNAKSWRGRIYPESAPAEKFLYYYARHFSTIELNTSHYRVPEASTVLRWRDQIPPQFLFCPKLFKGLSHARHGLRNDRELARWVEFLETLGPHAGPSFLQLPPYFDYAEKADLFHFVEAWPKPFRLSIEFRHPSWFEHGQILPALARYLSSRGVGLVITDVAGRRDVLHSTLSREFALLRFVGNEMDPTDTSRMLAWVERFEVWRKTGLRDLFLFLHEPNDMTVPELSAMTLAALRENAKLAVRWPTPSLREEPQLALL